MQSKIARKSPHMSPIFDFQSDDGKSLKTCFDFFDSLRRPDEGRRFLIADSQE